MKELNPGEKRFSSIGFLLSLGLVLFAIFLLFFIAYKALESQQEYLKNRNETKVVAQLSRISTEFFGKLAEEPPPDWAVPMPIHATILSRLKVPGSQDAAVRLLRLSLAPRSWADPITEAEMFAGEREKEFWRLLAARKYFEAGDFFQTRRLTFLISSSNYDYLLPTGITLKYEATLLGAKAFLAEGDHLSFLQRLYSLRSIPVALNEKSSLQEPSWLTSDDTAKRWLGFLGWCRDMSRSNIILPGRHNENGMTILLLKHKTGLMAYPGDQIEEKLRTLFNQSGFLDLDLTSNPGSAPSYRELEGSYGLFVKVTKDKNEPLSKGFLSLLALTSAVILGLVVFSMRQWKMLQKLRVLGEEEDFFRQVAHDLKTPMTTVKFLAETIYLKRFKTLEQEEKYLSQLQAEVDRAVELFEQLLMSARLRKNLIEANPEEINVEQIVGEVLGRFQARLAGWTIIRNTEPGSYVFADPKMFERVLVNLFENVLKHASDGKTIEMDIKAPAGFSTIEMTIGDHGSGFFEKKPHDARISLMSGELPFNPDKGGSGTGLFLIRQIMKAHGGDFYLGVSEKSGARVVTTWRKAEIDEEDSDNRR